VEILHIDRAGDLAAADSTMATAPRPSTLGSASSALSCPPPTPTAVRTTFAIALYACARLGDLSTGEIIKISEPEAAYNNDIFVCSSSLVCAVKVFHGIPRRDRITWSTMVTGFLHAREPVERIDQIGLVYQCNMLVADRNGSISAKCKIFSLFH
jgi:hypothetical protein